MNTFLKAVLDWLFGWAKEAVDDWRAGREARLRGAAEERERASREAERQEVEAQRAAEEAERLPPMQDDGWRRD